MATPTTAASRLMRVVRPGLLSDESRCLALCKRLQVARPAKVGDAGW
jgi:hypothetical protein